MSKKSDKKENLILIKWNDRNIMHGWRVSDECKNDGVAHCVTVGIVKEENEERITVAFGESDCGSVMETITIPKGCITEIKKLRVR